MNKKHLLVLVLLSSFTPFFYGMDGANVIGTPPVHQPTYYPQHPIICVPGLGLPQQGSNGSSGFGTAIGALLANWPKFGAFAAIAAYVLSDPRFHTFAKDYFLIKGIETTARSFKNWIRSFTPWDPKTLEEANHKKEIAKENERAAEGAKLKEKYKNTCKELKKLIDVHEELKKTQDNVLQENNTLKVTQAALSTELELKRKELENLHMRIDILTKKNDDLQNTNYSMTPLIDSSGTQLSILEGKINEQEGLIKKYKERIGFLKDKLKNQETEFTQKKSILEQTFEDKFKEKEREWNNKHNNLNNNYNELYRKNIELSLQLQSYSSNSLESTVFPRQSQSTVLTIFQPGGDQ